MLEVRCFATLSKYTPVGGKLEYRPNITVKDLLKELNIDKREVKVVFVNGVHASLDAPLRDGDRVGIFPAIGGG